jgi:hypothetical protein
MRTAGREASFLDWTGTRREGVATAVLPDEGDVMRRRNETAGDYQSVTVEYEHDGVTLSKNYVISAPDVATAKRQAKVEFDASHPTDAKVKKIKGK